MLVSIIVSIYNVQAVLPRCIDSLLAQTYRNIEIILVDDGSTDSSLSLCQEYEVKDSRIKVIHQDNKGTAEVRNTGIREAKGEYVGIVESDDFIEPDMFEALYAAAKKHYIKCGFYYAKDIDSVTKKELWRDGEEIATG